MTRTATCLAVGLLLAAGWFVGRLGVPAASGAPPKGESATPAKSATAAARQESPEPADNSYCLVCHANYEKEKLTKGHQPVGVGCETCHGESAKHSGDEDGLTPPDKMFAKEQVNGFCDSCHPKSKLVHKDYHKEWFKDRERDETCNDCHAEGHRIKVRTRVWDKKTRKLLSDDGVRMMYKDSPATQGVGQKAARMAGPAATSKAPGLFARENLVAWCIVPFDAKKRGPEERAAMLERLGIKRLAYDWRDEHVPTFDAELDALKRHGIELTAFWAPWSLDKNARIILDVLNRHHIRTQLWVMGSDVPPTTAAGQQKLIEANADRIRPLALEAAKIGCTVELYNHDGWFGEPENQIAIIKRLNLPNVGIVYNQHHGHQHLDRFPQLLTKMLPYLHALNLNGMRRGGGVLPLGAGDLDLQLLRTIRDSGYRGLIGILNHADADAEARLSDNLKGLDWLLPQLDGHAAGPKPVYRSWP
ncbi:MAG: TIM barrel protein [Planctomycetaceae bacterium]|nr:TIM barrel protein [Planctomycetaceae bacterium]